MTPIDPTPEEIEAATREIRKGWSAKERAKRRGIVEPPEWMPPRLTREHGFYEERYYSDEVI